MQAVSLASPNRSYSKHPSDAGAGPCHLQNAATRIILGPGGNELSDCGVSRKFVDSSVYHELHVLSPTDAKVQRTWQQSTARFYSTSEVMFRGQAAWTGGLVTHCRCPDGPLKVCTCGLMGSSLWSADRGGNKQINCFVYAEVSSDTLVQTKSRVGFQDSPIPGWSSKLVVSEYPPNVKSERALVALLGHLLCMNREVAWITQTHVHLWMALLVG